MIVDLHFHAGRDRVPRKYTYEDAAIISRDSRIWTVFKNHTIDTVDTAHRLRAKGYPVSGSVVLSNASHIDLGERLRSLNSINRCNGSPRLMVYYPTSFPNRVDPGVGVWFDEKCQLTSASKQLIRACVDLDIILCTGHLPCSFIFSLVDYIGNLKQQPKVLLTHATHPIGGFDLKGLHHMLDVDFVWIELTELTYRLGRANLGDHLDILQGPRVIISSDHGQPESPDREEWESVVSKTFADCDMKILREATQQRPFELLFD